MLENTTTFISDDSKPNISVTLPIRTYSESNSSENRFVKQRRHKTQKKLLWLYFFANQPKITLPCTIKLTRIANRRLDEHDNLRCSFKWIVDYIADYIIPGKAAGRADDSDQIKWEYDQIKIKDKDFWIMIEVFQVD